MNLSRTESPRRGGRNKSNHDGNGRFLDRRLAPTDFTRKLALQRLAVVVLPIRSTTGIMTPSSVCTKKHDKFITDGISSSRWSEQVQPRRQRTAAGGGRV
ncbi:serine/threonine-protein kinase rio2 [Dorcoceras hygrometricum]|uniref:Serine/threonine-protein kinase rio2 n=1 Tax=Dorcoceras hygrometricum TaxID=472368 RepID=A0A2Z7DAL6_9LAMI|nr:serine/threonine-protein kinase rio2 [Dorcoceras hygrometricum]